MDSIIPPAKGQPMRAAWAASVTDTVNRHERDLEATVGGGPVDRRSAIPAPFPFMVVGGTDGNGAAQFVICLPSGCLVNGSTALTPSGITALPGATDRYTVDSSALGNIGTTAAAASTLYVVVYQTTGTNASIESAITTNLSSVTTTTVNGSSQPNGNTILLALPVAKIFTTQVGSRTYGCVTKQLVRSSVWLDSGTGSSGSSSGYSTPHTSITGNETNSVAASGDITVVAPTTTGEESNVKVLSEDTTVAGQNASGRLTIGVYYV